MASKHKSAARKGFFDVPPVRYTGSKWQIADWIIDQFPLHDVYVEPYCGSASVFFRKHRSPVETLNDLDGEIINFSQVLRTRPDELVRSIELTPYARAEYEQALEPPVGDPLERARRFYVAAWQSFGGTLIYRSGWRHNLSAAHRSPVTDTWRRTEGLWDAAYRLKDAQIECLPALRCIQMYDGPDTLFYVDPPYVLEARATGRRRRYRHEMEDEDHRQLAETLRRVEGMVVLSGYRCDLYDELYAGWLRLDKSNTTNGNTSSVESLWISPTAQKRREPLFEVRR